VQSLHWAIQEAAELGKTLFCCYLDFANTFNSVDHAALWRCLLKLNVPDIGLENATVQSPAGPAHVIQARVYKLIMLCFASRSVKRSVKRPVFQCVQ
jgi:hypothetical protein